MYILYIHVHVLCIIVFVVIQNVKNRLSYYILKNRKIILLDIKNIFLLLSIVILQLS